MDYPWLNKFVIEAQEPLPKDSPPDESTGTNEPVDVPADEVNPEDQPNPELAGELTEGEPPTEDPGESLIDTSEFQTQIDDLKKQIEELQKGEDLQQEIEILKKKIDNVNPLDDTDLNDDIYQSASAKIKYLKRAMRRLARKAGLTGAQRQLIEAEMTQSHESTCQEIASKLAPKMNVSEQDIIDFIRNSEFRFRHRHGPRTSAIDWESL